MSDYQHYNGSPPSVHGSDTSAAAAESVRESVKEVQDKIEKAHALRGGYGTTLYDLGIDFPDLAAGTLTSRRRELHMEGRLAWHGKYRESPLTGHRQRIYEPGSSLWEAGKPRHRVECPDLSPQLRRLRIAELSPLRRRCYSFVLHASVGGRLADEFRIDLGWPQSRSGTSSGTMTDLCRMGLIKDSGGRRKTSCGRRAIVYVTT